MVAGQTPDQSARGSRAPPKWALALGIGHQTLHLLAPGGQHGTPPPRFRRRRASATGAFLAVVFLHLVADFLGDFELPADIGHRLPLQKPGDKAEAFFHHGACLPRHRHLPPKTGSVTYISGTFRHLSLGTEGTRVQHSALPHFRVLEIFPWSTS